MSLEMDCRLKSGMECILYLSDEHTIVEKIKQSNKIWKIDKITTYPYHIKGYDVTLMKYTNELSFMLRIDDTNSECNKKMYIRMMDDEDGRDDDNFFDIDCSVVNIKIDENLNIVFDRENCCYHSPVFINKYGFDIDELSDSVALQRQFINDVLDEFSNLDDSILDQCEPVHIKLLQRFIKI